MKKNILKVFILVISFTVGMGTGLSAQNYFSKPEATQNLSDAAKYINSTLDQLEETDENQFKVNKEKLRFINKMLVELKSSSNVKQAADNVLPKDVLNVIQPAVRFIDTSFANTTPNKYIRSEIMFLISY